MTSACRRSPCPTAYAAWLARAIVATPTWPRARAGRARCKQAAQAGEACSRCGTTSQLALADVSARPRCSPTCTPTRIVREQARAAEQEAHRLLTELSLDRELYEVLAAVDPDRARRGGQRVLDQSLRDFRRAGVDRDDATRERLRTAAREPDHRGRPAVLQEHPRRRAPDPCRPRAARRAARRTSARRTSPVRTGWSS